MAEETRLTLQGRVTVFIVILVILLVGAFTTIQIRNQIHTITDYNAYRAKVSALFVKTTLERILEKMGPEADPGALFKDSMVSFTRGGLVEKGVVIARPDRIIASTAPGQAGKSVSPEEALRVKDFFEVKEMARGTVTIIDKATKTLFMYIPVRSAGSATYVMRAAFSLGNIQEALGKVYRPIIYTSLIVVAIGIGFGVMLSKNVIGPIMVLNEATKYIAAGNLDKKVGLSTGDELEELADTFNDMTVALKRMKARAENANPLTRLPGNNVIREEIETRIKKNKKFVVVHTDLDNFKAFNDKYGIQKGDEAIKICCQVLEDGLANKGSASDFVGHEGGDDFVFITTPEKAASVTSNIINEFDRKIRSLYTEEDRKAGCIVAKGRDGKISKFPIMTVSLSGVSNQHRTIASYPEVTNIVAEIKKKAKSIARSVFVLDRRSGERKSPPQPPAGKKPAS